LIDNSPQVHAHRILEELFSWMRSVQIQERRLSSAGWSLELHLKLVSRLAEGCHNLPEIVAGRWSNRAAVSAEELHESLIQECSGLHRIAEGLQYPALMDSFAQNRWRVFWDLVAEPLDLPARYGIPYEKYNILTPEETYSRAHQQAKSKGSTIGYYGLRGALIRFLCGGDGFWVMRPTGNEERWDVSLEASTLRRANHKEHE
jgi:hypothetical protein